GRAVALHPSPHVVPETHLPCGNVQGTFGYFGNSCSSAFTPAGSAVRATSCVEAASGVRAAYGANGPFRCALTQPGRHIEVLAILAPPRRSVCFRSPFVVVFGRGSIKTRRPCHGLER